MASLNNEWNGTLEWSDFSQFFFLQVVPGRAGGGSFKRKKNHIAEKEFAYRMCARWPTIAMSIFFFGFERSFCRCMAVMSCDLGWCVCDLTSFHQVMWLVVRWFVLLRSYSLLQRPTTYYSSTTPTCYSVLQRTTPGLQSITPVLLCTTKYYSLLQSITPVLLCTTKYYSSSTPVLLQYYSALQSTTPVKRQYYSVLQSTMPVLVQYYEVLVRGASEVTLQPHQILRLPRKMNVINDLRHIWNLISNARSK